MQRGGPTSLWNQLLAQIHDANSTFSETSLCVFPGYVGSRATGELCVIGRAVNGWEVELTPADTRSDLSRAKFIQEKLAQDPSQECPMRWVVDQWGVVDDKGTYNTKRSAFWRVTRSLCKRLCVGTEDDWASHLMWTNLYRVAPQESGNPSGRLIDVQFPVCHSMLLADLLRWRPKRVLALTGWDWAEDFFDSGSERRPARRGRRFVERVFQKRLVADGRVTTFVVSRHPQGKPESQHVDEIVAAFADTS